MRVEFINSNLNLNRFLGVDPLTKSYPELTPYQFASNTPIQTIDLDGLEARVIVNKILKVDGELKIVHSFEIKPEDAHHGQVGSFNDYANQKNYGTRGTLVVNEFLDPYERRDGNKLKKYEYLELSNLDYVKNTIENIKNIITITPGEGGTQKGGVTYTDGEDGGAMETKDQALSEDVKIVDIRSLLIYLNYSKRDISTHAATIRDLSDPEVMVDAADLI